MKARFIMRYAGHGALNHLTVLGDADQVIRHIVVDAGTNATHIPTAVVCMSCCITTHRVSSVRFIKEALTEYAYGRCSQSKAAKMAGMSRPTDRKSVV